MRHRSGQTQPLQTLLLAAIADELGLLLGRYSKPGTPQPVSILDTLSRHREEKPKAVVFRSGADFMAAYSRIVR